MMMMMIMNQREGTETVPAKTIRPLIRYYSSVCCQGELSHRQKRSDEKGSKNRNASDASILVNVQGNTFIHDYKKTNEQTSSTNSIIKTSK